MTSRLHIVGFPDSRQATGHRLLSHVFGSTFQQLLRLPPEVGTLERVTTKWNQSTLDSCVASGRGQHLLLEALPNTYIYLLSLFSDRMPFLFLKFLQ